MTPIASPAASSPVSPIAMLPAGTGNKPDLNGGFAAFLGVQAGAGEGETGQSAASPPPLPPAIPAQASLAPQPGAIIDPAAIPANTAAEPGKGLPPAGKVRAGLARFAQAKRGASLKAAEVAEDGAPIKPKAGREPLPASAADAAAIVIALPQSGLPQSVLPQGALAAEPEGGGSALPPPLPQSGAQAATVAALGGPRGKPAPGGAEPGTDTSASEGGGRPDALPETASERAVERSALTREASPASLRSKAGSVSEEMTAGTAKAGAFITATLDEPRRPQEPRSAVLFTPADGLARADSAPVSTAPSAADPRHDFTALVDRLIDARKATEPRVVEVSVRHAEFGDVSVRFNSAPEGLSVSLSSPDPDFARAVDAASAASRDGTASDRGNNSDRGGNADRGNGSAASSAGGGFARGDGGNGSAGSQAQPQARSHAPTQQAASPQGERGAVHPAGPDARASRRGILA